MVANILDVGTVRRCWRSKMLSRKFSSKHYTWSPVDRHLTLICMDINLTNLLYLTSVLPGDTSDSRNSSAYFVHIHGKTALKVWI